MNKITVLLLLYTLVYTAGQAQPVMKQVQLKPIHYEGGRYYYDGVRLMGGTYGVQVPLMAVEDDEVNRRFKKYRTLHTISNLVNLVPLAYLYFLSNNQAGSRQITQQEFWLVFGGTIVTSIAGESIARHQLNLAIDRYNVLILKPSSRSLGLSLEYRF